MTTLLQTDSEHLARAIELASGGRGRVFPNPLVGAVLVTDGLVLSDVADSVGAPDGVPALGTPVVGALDGCRVGVADGFFVGFLLGFADGCLVGWADGVALACTGGWGPGGPPPACRGEGRPRAVSPIRTASRPASAEPLVAARKPTPRCRSWRTRSRPD